MQIKAEEETVNTLTCNQVLLLEIQTDSNDPMET